MLVERADFDPFPPCSGEQKMSIKKKELEEFLTLSWGIAIGNCINSNTLEESAQIWNTLYEQLIGIKYFLISTGRYTSGVYVLVESAAEQALCRSYSYGVLRSPKLIRSIGTI